MGASGAKVWYFPEGYLPEKVGSGPLEAHEALRLLNPNPTLATVNLDIYFEDTEQLQARQRVKRFRAFERVAQRKLRQLDIATELRDLASPPGNHLEALKGARKGQHSIRIDDQTHRLPMIWKWLRTSYSARSSVMCILWPARHKLRGVLRNKTLAVSSEGLPALASKSNRRV